MENLTPKAWWSSRRSLFNRILLSAAPVSFFSLLVVWWVFESRLPSLEITLPSLFLGGIFFLFFFTLANVFYYLGPLTESLISPVRVLRFRRSAFAAGILLCVTFIFFPVIGNLVAAWASSSSEAACAM